MATTTNYGWTTPNDTDLVKDGAAAIRTLGSSIDSTVFTNAGASIAKTIVDAKGDIIAATAADTVSRLAVGANDTVLMADSTAATGLKWATPSSGGMTLISTTTLSGASVTLSSIPQTYNSLRLVIRNYLPSDDGSRIQMRINSDANTRYGEVGVSTGSAAETFASSKIFVSPSADNAVSTNLSVIDIPDYTNAVTWKQCIVQSISVDATTNTSFRYANFYGFYNQTAAITSLLFLPNAGTFTSGSILLYGVK
jgi:hypothetical protein